MVLGSFSVLGARKSRVCVVWCVRLVDDIEHGLA